MKLIDILKELEKPEQIYGSDYKPESEGDASKLTPLQRKELFKQGYLRLGDKVVYLPKLDKAKKNILDSKEEFEVFQYYPDETIKAIAKEINKLHNQLYSSMKALDKILELKKAGKA